MLFDDDLGTRPIRQRDEAKAIGGRAVGARQRHRREGSEQRRILWLAAGVFL